MRIGLGAAFVLAIMFHGALLAALVINVSLDKPKRPEEKSGQIIHATIVNVPPAKGNPAGKEPEGVKVQDTARQAAEAAAKAKAEAEAKARAELEKQLAAQRKAEAERQKALALKKAEEEKKKAEEEAKKKAEEEKKKKAEEEKKKAEEEKKKKAEAEAKKKAEEEAKKKAEAEAEAKKKAELEALAKQMEKEQLERLEAEKMKNQADNLEDDILGQANGVEGGQGLGAGTGSDESLTYGSKVQQLIEQNWRIDPSMNGKKVVVTVSIDQEGMIYNEKCQGDRAVCASAIATLNLIGMMPRPPKGCKDCNTIVITMIPKV
ncbi:MULTISPECIES: cell envelope integrity protein TolA [unclassified Anaerobiospirillum]|uniref:cell envelope integrity protein TolA n=1 Tax=unclassified Anaerobiospirillum TaxID=2647410 RepID=UPI001FF65664|nr:MULTISPECIES: cell envelope integrity protein TolA [unclassified Anaerobiospirillum]MCK0533735.1 cell envelope integrity protein TolA [Anaerobiospirillum sp. NML120511]MCK0540024.1 cell envelope integrity protein TolA [Anaerobiospirillum sp. NML02-A-032]